MLRNDVKDFWVAEQYFPHLRCRRFAGFQANRRWHRRPDPQIAFFQRRQELAAEARAEDAITARNAAANVTDTFPVIASDQRRAGV